tara:strand:- start:837 stop:941 length:105 start_codon:yes stop_codon:yes gene_type:complete
MMNELSLGSLLSLGIFLFIVIGMLVAVSYLERKK